MDSSVALRPGLCVVQHRRSVCYSDRDDVEAAVSWTTGRLIFRETPLSAAVAEINRYSRQPLSVEAGAISQTPINGSFEAGDSEAFVAAVSDLFGLVADRQPNGTIVLKPRPSAG